MMVTIQLRRIINAYLGLFTKPVLITILRSSYQSYVRHINPTFVICHFPGEKLNPISDSGLFLARIIIMRTFGES